MAQKIKKLFEIKIIFSLLDWKRNFWADINTLYFSGTTNTEFLKQRKEKNFKNIKF